MILESSFLVLMVFFLINHDHDVHELLFLVVNALLVLMVFFLVSHDHNVHKLLSCCC